MSMHLELDIQEILDKKSITIHFQPIVNLGQRSVFGLEALARGIAPHDKSIIPPQILFRAAHEQGLALELDRLCRATAMQLFRDYNLDEYYFLFLNLDTSFSSDAALGSQWIKKVTESIGLNPNKIAIEIVEASIEDDNRLIDFVTRYKSYGFILAMDDFGAASSDFSRFSKIKPDIIKIDRGLINGVSKDEYKHAIVKMIYRLSESLGIITLAEGVEELDDVIQLKILGIDLIQGFFFAKPHPLVSSANEDIELRKCCGGKIDAAMQACYSFLDKKLKLERLAITSLKDIVQKIINQLSKDDRVGYEYILQSSLNISPRIECLFTLNTSGELITETYCNYSSKLFSPAQKRATLIGKNYFYIPKILEIDEYITDVYISLATKKPCRTIAKKFRNKHGETDILCVDFSFLE